MIDKIDNGKYFDPLKLLNIKELVDVYQFQALNKNTGVLKNIGAYEKIPFVKILEFPYIFELDEKNQCDYLQFKCDVISNIVTIEDISNDYYKLISILFYLDTYLVFSLNYSFYPNIKNDTINKNIEGCFKINLEYRKDKKEFIKIIENNTEYISNNEIISNLISILDDPKFKEQIEYYRCVH
jgi:hypothetical protein